LITDLRLRNFKSVQKDEIELRPLTIFTGPNSSGKSNIIQSIATMAQIARMITYSGSTDFPASLENPNAEYYRYPAPSAEFVVYKGELEREITIEVHMRSDISKRCIGYSIKYTPEKVKTQQTLFLNKRPIFQINFVSEDNMESSKFERPLRWHGEKTQYSARFLLVRNSFWPEMETVNKKKDDARKLDLRLIEEANSLVKELAKELSKIYLISAPRGTILAETPVGPDPMWVGKNGENLIYILSKIYGKQKFKLLQEKISDWSERFGLGHMTAGLKKGAILGADFEDPTLRTAFDINSASYGSKQLLTIITQIFWSKPGDILLIEEPEISLHPESQALIQELFAEAVADHKQIICSTHSPSFILSLSRVIGKKLLSKDDVGVYHVEKSPEGTRTKRLELNDKGFVKGWIPSYIKIENQLFDEWAETLGQNSNSS
jgi:predicted ATPase